MIENSLVTDPTKLTTERLDHEIATLKELLESKIECMEQAHVEFKETFNILHAESKKEIEAKIQFIKELHSASLNSLKELHNAAIHDTQKNAELLTSMLQATVIKSEGIYIKQFDAINQNNMTQNKATADRIDDLKERIDRDEGRGNGRTDLWGWIVAGVTALIAFLEYRK